MRWACGMYRWFAALTVLLLGATAVAGQTLVVEGTLEAALGHPKVWVQLSNGPHVLNRRAAPSDYFRAYLDTGASASVLTHSTLAAFGAEAHPHGRFHEYGLAGETAMRVSLPYGVALASNDDVPPRFERLSDETRFEVNTAAVDPVQQLVTGELNVIGMPFIRGRVVEIRPGIAPPVSGPGLLQRLGQALGGQRGLDTLNAALDGPALTLHPPSFSPRRFDFELVLTYRDFSRHRNPADVAPAPSLAPNPVVERVILRHRGKTSVGDWLLDTGASTSFVSTAQARSLGVLDRSPSFTMPISGISGRPVKARGYRIDRLELRGVRKKLVFKNAHVLVFDIAATLDDGRRVILDGVLGNNLLLPSVGGLANGIPDRANDSPFATITIDGPKGRAFFKLR